MVHQVKQVEFQKNLRLAAAIKDWIEAQDSPVTIRRVFYAMVTHGIIDNTQSEYRRISRVTTDLRRGGYLDWDLIVDGTRNAYKTASYDSIEDAVERAISNFRYDRWANQHAHVQVWVEKRGHVSMLYPITNRYDVSVCDNGGRRAVNEELVLPFLLAQREGRRNIILYVGDYDPSGLQMDVNLQDQLADWGAVVEFRRVALTYEHLHKYNLPRAYMIEDDVTDAWLRRHPLAEVQRYVNGKPKVNKLEKDPNADWFRRQHNGDLFQVEVDALEVDVLRGLIEDAIKAVADVDELALVQQQEDNERERVRSQLRMG